MSESDEQNVRDDERVRDRIRKRAVNLIEFAPRTADELRGRLAERPWARGRSDLIESVIAQCEKQGLLGGPGHEKAMRDRLFAYAVDLLARAARTERDLRRRLSRPVWSSPSIVEDVVESLRRYGYLDDEAFAKRFADHRASAGKGGARRLRLELRAKGRRGSRDDRTRGLGGVRASARDRSIDALIAKRLRGKAPDVVELRRIRDFLLRRGFDPGLVSERLRAVGKNIVGDEDDS